jgi:hypothetical protein
VGIAAADAPKPPALIQFHIICGQHHFEQQQPPSAPPS